jgi:cellulose synthase/poly-beta-1,6-N-acetylglucosamine synthase-like glycosyltransferase
MSALRSPFPVMRWRRPTPSAWMLALTSTVVAIGLPSLAYAVMGKALPGSIGIAQEIVATAYVFTAVMTLLEARAATGARDEPELTGIDDLPGLAELPSLTVIVSAYLPNEQTLVVDTIVNLATELRTAPGKLQIILAYNTPEDMPDLERMLQSLAELNVAFAAVRVTDSRSKAENVNAALGLAEGEVTLLLDADHRPAPDAAVRALRWFAEGYDIVQGRCVVRDAESNWLSRIVAVEFEEMYAVAHAGRSLAFDTAVFCGTNGWWRTSVLREIQMDSQMLTEDIDSSVRALLAGYRAVHDRSIISTELAPPTMKAWWGQRIRWAQGWFQVTLKHVGAVRRSPKLTRELKLYWTYILGWRQICPVLSLQIFSLLLADVILGRPVHWFDNPFLVLTTGLTFFAGPMVVWFTYRVSLPARRRQLRRTFIVYGITALVYTTVKNTVAMVAAVRELIGQRAWVVTRRAVPGAAAAAIALGTAGVAGGVTAPPAQAAADGPVTMSLGSVDPVSTLSGRAPVQDIPVSLPADWSGVSGLLKLRWQASPQVTPNSTLTVLIGGKPAAVQRVLPGPGGVDVPIGPEGGARQLQIELSGQLHTEIGAGCCAPDPGTAAIIALDPSASSLTVTGVRSAARPLLADVPGDLVDAVGRVARPLFIALPAQPTTSEVRAAAVIVGAVDRAAGATVPIRIVRDNRLTAVQALPGNVIRVWPSGPAAASVRRTAGGRLLLTLGGNGDGTLIAATALASSKPHFYPGTWARFTGGLDTGATAPATSRVTIAPAGISGTGSLTATGVFKLPESRQVLGGKAKIHLGLAYNAPAGGRVEVSLNGVPVQSVNLPAGGRSQMQLETGVVVDPADAVGNNVNDPLYPGDNIVTIQGNLPPGQPLGGAGDAEPPSVAIMPSSTVTFSSRPRTGPASLGMWPWPFLVPGASHQATFVLPTDPNEHEIAAAVSVIGAASLWSGQPLDPDVLIGPARLPNSDVVLLERGVANPVPLPAGAPTPAQPGLLETYTAGGHQILVALGYRALAPLGSGYAVGKITGVAALVVGGGHAQTLVNAPALHAFPPRPLAWQIPAAVLVLAAIGLLVLITVRARRRLRELPPPEPAPHVDELSIEAQLEAWKQLAAQEKTGSGSV